MFRKITSKRDPQTTIGGELKKEFAAYFQQAEHKGRWLASRYPRQFFTMMVVSILFSGVLAFTVMREDKPGPIAIKPAFPQPAVSGIGQIMKTADALQEVWAIQAQVNSLLKKSKLDAADSLLLRRALDKIDSIQKQLHGGTRDNPTHLKKDQP